MSRPPKYLECLVDLNIRLKPETKEGLRDLAQAQSVIAGKQVSMSELIRPYIEAGLVDLQRTLSPEGRRATFFRETDRTYEQMVPGSGGWALCECCEDIEPLNLVAMVRSEAPVRQWFNMCHPCSSAAFNAKPAHKHRYTT
jgi:hypothetical protein